MVSGESSGIGTDHSAGAGASERERTSILLRLDPAVHDALARWATEDLRSTNARIEFLLRALADTDRLPSRAALQRRPGCPAKATLPHP